MNIVKAIFLLVAGTVFLNGACKGNKHNKTMAQKNQEEPVAQVAAKQILDLPNIIIYKTTADTYNLVPVLLSKDHTEVLSYPHPKDLMAGDELRLPIKLKNGYYLDQKGIGPETSFLTYTYKQYSALEALPGLNQLLGSIKYKSPVVEMYNLGKLGSFKNPVAEINTIITENKLGNYKKLK